jgi:hypothetical protein
MNEDWDVPPPTTPARYLMVYLELADRLPAQLDGVPDEIIVNLQQRLRRLVELCSNRDETIRKLTEQIEGDL